MVDLAEIVRDAANAGSDFKMLYPSDMGLEDKIRTIATKVYGADDVKYDIKARREIAKFEDMGYGDLPICMAKTQYSFSTDSNLLGAPTGHVVPIREVRLAAGAEFVVIVCGAIMTMPGLPRVPAANNISVNEEGRIEGLF